MEGGRAFKVLAKGSLRKRLTLLFRGSRPNPTADTQNLRVTATLRVAVLASPRKNASEYRPIVAGHSRHETMMRGSSTSQRATRYFTRRERPETQSAELDQYWQEATDPDGNLRRPHEETEQRLLGIRAELAFMEALPGGRVLDVGCGVGVLLSALSGKWEKHGVEVSTFAANRAREHASVHLGTVESAGYPEHHFDLVVLHHVIEHMDDPVAAVRQCFRILKPDGRLLVGTPDFDSPCARRFQENFRLLHDATHISLFSRDSLRRLLEDTGFVVDYVDTPFFDTPYFTSENLARLFDTSSVSPPFVGNVVTFYCTKPARQRAVERLALATRVAQGLLEQWPEQSLSALAEVLGHEGGVLFGVGGTAVGLTWRHLCETRGARALEHVAALHEARPPDVLLVFDLDDAPPDGAARLMAVAAERNLHRICIARSGAQRLPCDSSIELPAADLHVTDLALRFVLAGLAEG